MKRITNNFKRTISFRIFQKNLLFLFFYITQKVELGQEILLENPRFKFYSPKKMDQLLFHNLDLQTV